MSKRQTNNREALRINGFSTSIKLINNSNNEEVSTNGLIDTGAKVSLIDYQAIKDLKISPSQIIGKREITTASDKKVAFICHLDILFDNEMTKEFLFENIEASFFPSSELLSLGHAGAIIGRDILQYFDFNWNGPKGLVDINNIENIKVLS